jgi:hypothetical protein
MGQLLMRGMLAGLLAALLAFSFAKVYGEPQVDRAITFEEHQHSHSGNAEEPELVSREVQASIGLFTGVVVFGTALGGLFALAYAFVGGRLVHFPPRTTAILIAVLGFLAVYIVPYLKYPANPPAVGDPDTITYRTQLFFGMIAFSIAAMAIAISAGRQFADKLGSWNAILAGGAIYVVLTALAAYMLPPINEVPKTFPADLLWNFRVVSFGIQGILWIGIGLVFGLLTDRALERKAHLS